jgi:hypothetical protein
MPGIIPIPLPPRRLAPLAAVAALAATLALSSLATAGPAGGSEAASGAEVAAGADTDGGLRELVVQKTVTAHLSRDWDWSIAKTALDGDGLPITALNLEEGRPHFPGYRVTVQGLPTDSQFWLSGTITVTNPNPDDDVIVSVSESLPGAVIECIHGPDTTPGGSYYLSRGQTLECTYRAPSDGSDGINTATATYELDGEQTTSSASVPYSFTNPTHENAALDLEESDATVSVTDDLGTAAPGDDRTYEVSADELGGDGSYVIEYRDVDVNANVASGFCGQHEFTNTATLSSDDGESRRAAHTLAVTIECALGCTRTQGYWRTHNDSFRGGAPTDGTWYALLGNEGEQATFFPQGEEDEGVPSYFDVMWTSPKGNAYYLLARQYIAAKLNVEAGASAVEIASAITAAEQLLADTTLASARRLRGDDRREWIELAGTLADYNEGRIGPGHCDDVGHAGGHG